MNLGSAQTFVYGSMLDNRAIRNIRIINLENDIYKGSMYNENIHRKEGKIMDQKLMDAITEKTKELRDAVTCSAEAKAAAQAWLDAVGTQQIESMTQAYLKELEEDIVAIDDLIALAESEQGKQIFGEEKASQVAEHARKIKQKGAVYCDCPACAAAACILEKKEELLEAVKN